MILRYLITAKYKDGFIYNATQEDTSEFNSQRNSMHAVLEHRKIHGPITDFAVISTTAINGKGMRFDIDFTKLPDDTRPIFYMVRTIETDHGSYIHEKDAKYFFGYQCTIDGKNYQDIKELP